MARKPPSPILTGFLQRIATAVMNAAEDKARGDAIIRLAPRLIDLPDTAFSEACVSAVFDSGPAKDLHADVVFQRIHRWWEANRPRRPGEIPREVEASSLPLEAKRWAAYWIGRLQDGALAMQLRLALSLVRSQSPEAFEWLVRNESEAGITARHAGFLTSAVRQAIARRDWQDPRKVELALASCEGFHDDDRRSRVVPGLECRTTLRVIVGRWAPENLHLLDAPASDPGPSFFRGDDPGGDSHAAPADPPMRSVFGAEAEPPTIFGRPLTREALAASYATIDTGPAQYRAGQLSENPGRGEDDDAASRGEDPDRY